MEFHNVNRILVIKLRHIGDVLMTVPVFRALKQTFPSACTTALVNAGTEEVLKGNAYIDEILVFDRAIKRLPALPRYKREADFLAQVRKDRFDMTVDLTGGDRAALLSICREPGTGPDGNQKKDSSERNISILTFPGLTAVSILFCKTWMPSGRLGLIRKTSPLTFIFLMRIESI